MVILPAIAENIFLTGGTDTDDFVMDGSVFNNSPQDDE